MTDSFDPIEVSTPHFSSTRFPNPSHLEIEPGSGELLSGDKIINHDRNSDSVETRLNNHELPQFDNDPDNTQCRNNGRKEEQHFNTAPSSKGTVENNSNTKEENLINDFDSKFSSYELDTEDEISFDDLNDKNKSDNLNEGYSKIVGYNSSKMIESTSSLPLNLIPKEVHKIMAESSEAVDDDLESFQCNICDAKFRRKSSLVNHKRSHTKEFFRCLKCPITFRYKRALLEHEKIHYIYKTFKCSECDFSSMRKCSLMSHYRSHRKKFTCMYCDFKCSLIKKMEKHYLKHKNTPQLSN
ncbi:Zinc finger protein 1 [Armadillidium vulgare]|nr:Zinc finger protein 1 [Armadillidium vulgare]